MSSELDGGSDSPVVPDDFEVLDTPDAEQRTAEVSAPTEAAPETAEKAPQTDQDKRKGNPRHDPQARVAQATREAKEAREETARLRSELDHERRSRIRETDTPPARPAKPEGAPKSEDYDTYEAFLDARDEHRDRQREARYAQREEEQGRARDIDSLIRKYDVSVKEAKKADPQFWDKISEDVQSLLPTFHGGAPNASTWMADEIVDNAEDAPALLLHLSEHPEDFQRIAALSSPRAVTRAMANLVTRLDAEPTDTSSKPTVSRARPPVKPVTGSPVAAGEPGDASDFDTHLKYYNAKERKR